MKIFSILTCLFLVNISCNSQEINTEKTQPKIGITYSSFGQNEAVHFQQLEGSGSYDSDSFFTLGLMYAHPLNNWLFLETGFEYSEHSIIGNSNLPPDMGNYSYKSDLTIINIPITVTANFWKYLFINGGLIVDIDVSNASAINSQSGLGALLGIGAKYDFNFGGSVFVNPYLKAHSLVNLSSSNYPLRIMESGLRIGVTYNL